MSSIALLLVAIAAGCTESRIEPTPARFDESAVERVVYGELPPHHQRLLTAMKEGRLEGANASDFEADLAKADDVQRDDGKTNYIFELKSIENRNSEGPVSLFILVQDKYGHIIHHGLAEPEW